MRTAPVMAAVATLVFSSAVGLAYAATPTPTESPAETATPTPTASSPPTPTPSPLPTPTPYAGPASTITVRFVRDGQPLISIVGSPRAYANGAQCDLGARPAVVVEAIEWAEEWPPPLHQPNPDCAQVGAVIKMCFGSACAQVVWEGKDTFAQLEVPSLPGQSIVAARFMSKGAPVRVTLDGWDYTAGGESCLDTGTSRAAVRGVASISRYWPTQSFSPACAAPRSTIIARFNTMDFGLLVTEFVWTGGDMVVDVDVPGALPPTGGSPGEHAGLPSWTVLLILGTVLLVIPVLAFRRRR